MAGGPPASSFRAAVRALAAAPRLALRGFGAELVLLRAAALTYLTIVSLVPLIAIALQLLRTLGLLDLRQEVRRFVLSSLAVGARPMVEQTLDRLFTSAGARTASLLGFALLLVSSLLLLRNIERAFSDLWGLHRARPLLSRVPAHLGLLLAGPVALGLSLALTAALRAWAATHRYALEGALLEAAPLFIAVAGFTALYQIAPAARVRFRAALAGGLAAAVVWEAAKWAYAAYAARALRTDLIYGPLGALPLFFIWIYVSWLITLLGGRLAYALQHPEGVLLAADDQEAARAVELCALRVCVSCAQAAGRGEAATLHGLAAQLQFPEALVRKAVQLLEDQEILVVSGAELRLQAPPAETSLGDVLGAIRRHTRRPDRSGDPLGEALEARIEEADRRAAQALEGESLEAFPAPPGGVAKG